MHVVRHDNELIENDHREMGRNLAPEIVDDTTYRRQPNSSILDGTKQRMVLERADRHEVGAITSIVEMA